MVQSQRSVDGCYRAFDSQKRSHRDLHLVLCPERNLDTFYAAASRQVTYGGRRVGIFVWDDEMAVAVLRTVSDLGLSVPEQVGIVGFDDIDISSYLPQALTTVFYRKFEMGKLGAERLIERLNSKQVLPYKNLQLSLRLVGRETA
jgi:LacI family transcriptional regulator